jgi:DNA-binding HxlR family transcriptional regulator
MILSRYPDVDQDLRETLRCIDSGLTTTAKVMEKIGWSERMTQRRFRSLHDRGLISRSDVTTTKGILRVYSLTEDGRKVLRRDTVRG